MIRQSLTLPFQIEKSSLLPTNPQLRSPKNVLSKKNSKRRYTQLRQDTRQSNGMKPGYLAQILKQSDRKQMPAAYPLLRNHQLSVQFLQDVTNITSKPLLIICAYLTKIQLTELCQSLFTGKISLDQYDSVFQKNLLCFSMAQTNALDLQQCKILLLVYPQQGPLKPLNYATSVNNPSSFVRNQSYDPVSGNLNSYNNKTILSHHSIDMPPSQQLLANSFRIFMNLCHIFITNSAYLKQHCEKHLQQKNDNSLQKLLRFQQSLLVFDSNNELRKKYPNILDLLNGSNQFQLYRTHNFEDRIKQIDSIDINLNENLNHHQQIHNKDLSAFWDVQILQKSNETDLLETIFKRSMKHNSYNIANISNRLFLYLISVLLKSYDNNSLNTIEISINEYRKQLQKAYSYKLDNQAILPMHQIEVLQFLGEQKNYFLWLAQRDSKLFNQIGKKHVRNQFGIEIQSKNQKSIRKSTESQASTSDPFSLASRLKQFILSQESEQYELNNQLAHQHNRFLMEQLYQQKIGKKLKQGYYSCEYPFQTVQSMGQMIDSQIPFQAQKTRFSNESVSQKYQKQSIQLLQQDFIDLISSYKIQSFQVPSQLETFNTFMREIKNNLINQIVNQLNKKATGSVKKEDQLEDQINMQKGILTTLERQIKQLQNQRRTVEDRNQKHKNYIEQLSKMKQKTEKKKRIRDIISLEERSSDSSKIFNQISSIVRNPSHNIEFKYQGQKSRKFLQKNSPLKLKTNQQKLDATGNNRTLSKPKPSQNKFKTFQIDQQEQTKQRKCCCCEIM